MSTYNFTIGDHEIGDGLMPYVIAEIGSNHGNDLDQARRLIDIAVDCGADAAKFQLFFAEELYPVGHEYHEAVKAVELPVDWLEHLKAHCDDAGIHFFASVFGQKSADALLEFDVPAIKIASSETTKLDLVSYVAATGKPMLVSTGMCDMIDVAEAVTACRLAGNEQLALMQCSAVYPLPAEQVNLRIMDTFRSQFPYPVGYSDHSEGANAILASVAKGASVIEKHITFDRSADGPDHFYAMEPEPFKELVASIREVHTMLGSPEKEMLPQEKEYGRRDGLYAARDLQPGDVIGEDDLDVKRPALGIRSRYRDTLIGRTVANAVKADDAIQWQDLQHTQQGQ